MSDNYQYIKKSYRSEGLAGNYDAKRFMSDKKQLLNRRFLSAIAGIINYIRSSGLSAPVVLDMPCGAGRTFQTFLDKGVDFIGADISMEMMLISRQKVASPAMLKLVQCDAERMPFRDNSFDVVVCLRFLTMRVPAEVQRVIFREMSRLSRGWVVLECRRRSAWSNIWYWGAKLFLNRPRFNYFSRDEIKRELAGSGIRLVRIFTPFGLFSNKWLLLGRVEPDSIASE